jgi:hypothetical protein
MLRKDEPRRCRWSAPWTRDVGGVMGRYGV